LPPTPCDLRLLPGRTVALPGWLERYNYRRRHGALGHRPPIARLRELTGNNVAGIYNRCEPASMVRLAFGPGHYSLVRAAVKVYDTGA
jgi:hypothetical protein